MATHPKKTRGRQRVALERMDKETNRMVTYSKRRGGVLKKISELVTLCGVQALCLIFSPAKKPVAYGHPSVEAIINRFMPEDNNVPQNNQDSSETFENESISRSNKEVSLLKDQIDHLKKCAEELGKERKSKSEEAQRFLEPPETFTYHELKQIQAVLIALRNNVHTHARNLEAWSNLSSNPNPGHLILDGQNTQGQISFLNPPNMVVGPTHQTDMGWNPIPGQTFLMGEGSSNSPALPFNPQSRYMGSNPIPGDYQIFTNFIGEGSSNPPYNTQGGFGFGPEFNPGMN